ncbi:Ribonuclease H-like superfamily protein, partial [Melia azedarach]
KVLAAALRRTMFSGNVDFAEAEAMRAGIEVAKEACLTPIIIESDSSKLVQLVKGRKNSMNETYWVINEIQELVKPKGIFYVCNILRVCNSVAHNITKLALTQK